MMKARHIITSLMLLSVMIGGCLIVVSDDTDVEGATYTYNAQDLSENYPYGYTFNVPAGTYIIINDYYDGYEGWEASPNHFTVNGLTVTALGTGLQNDAVFNDQSLSRNVTVTIPSTVTQINAYAFSSTRLTGDIIIPNSVASIGDYAFKSSHITSLDLGSVRSVGDEAFADTTLTGGLTIPGTVTQMGTSVFQNSVSLDGTLIIDGNPVIGHLMINGTSLKGLLILGEPSMQSDSLYNPNQRMLQVMNFGNLDITTTSYGMDAEEVRNDIDALLYLAPREIIETYYESTDAQKLIGAIPVLLILFIIMVISGFIIYRKT